LDRMRNRFRVQFLSYRTSDGRGCTFYSELKRGQVRTNSDIASLFALSASEIITSMRLLQDDIYPNRAVLNDFSVSDSRTIELTFTLYTTEGNIVDNIEVTE